MREGDQDTEQRGDFSSGERYRILCPSKNHASEETEGLSVRRTASRSVGLMQNEEIGCWQGGL